MLPNLQLSIKPLNETVKPFYENHKSFHYGDAGVDLYCVDKQIIDPHALGVTIRFYIQCELYKLVSHTWHDTHTGRSGGQIQHHHKSYMLVPRSSISKTPLRMSNCIGIIDAGYRGEIMAKVDNLSDDPFYINKGDRYFQLVSGTLKSMEVEVVEELSETTRGSGGFGSTN